VLAVHYDPVLVALSIVVAMMASFTGIALTTGNSWTQPVRMKSRIMRGALVIGGGIWSMHFIGMLAVELPVAMRYEVLQTLVSALIAILLTLLGLYIVAYQPFRRLNLATAGLFMGCGIAGMHYIGMSGMRGAFALEYWLPGVVFSAVVAIAASMAALWFAFRRGSLRQMMVVGAVLGGAIAAMHYTAMLATRFIRLEETPALGTPTMSSDYLAIVVALPVFVIFLLSLLISLPEKPPALPPGEGDQAAEPSGPGRADAPVQRKRVPVHKNGTLHYLTPGEIVSVVAQGHYSLVYTRTDEYFCDHSIAALERSLGSDLFLRSHRSHLVNLAYVAGLGRDGDRGFLVIKPDEAERRVPVSRSKLERVRLRLESGVPSGA